MLKSPPAAAAWGDDYQESNGRVAEQKQLQLKAIHRPRLKSGSVSSVRQTTETHGAADDRGTWRRVAVDAAVFGSQTQASVKKRKPSAA
ncbi:unnamed protein product [Staurois parvus]|uniref:Uncharacterized protein n=1 Tax=Staurois parvus TaxID=386267 RepID=A0ABN9HVB8_9NEOB|nr:unnamed protein product [Staurois parvus]